MLILNARVEGDTDLKTLCYEAADLCNRLGLGIDVSFEEQIVEARPATHPYNLIQTFERAARERG